MSDAADKTQERIENEERVRRKFQQLDALEVDPTGECLNCGEVMPSIGMRWCDAACRSDWEYRRDRENDI